MPAQDDAPAPADATGRVVWRGPDPAGERSDPRGLREELDAMERRRVVEALERCGNNQSRAAKLLGISRHALIARIERFQLQRPRKGAGE
jgi:DNA-binding NtrC family response regulator